MRGIARATVRQCTPHQRVAPGSSSRTGRSVLARPFPLRFGRPGRRSEGSIVIRLCAGRRTIDSLVATIDRIVADEVSTSFADLRLSPTTLQALERMDIVTPTPIQAAALPALLDGRDLIGQARTGSGK